MTEIDADSLVEAGLANSTTALEIVDTLRTACERFDINTPQRLAGFLSQCAHESSLFRTKQENLNYSAARLVQVFPRYFDSGSAAGYGHKPEAIANRIYAGRMGNGDEESGDGWRFRGRGYIQLTGRSNYEAFGKTIGEDVAEDPDIIAGNEMAAMSAGWFWSAHGLNKLADAEDVLGMTKRINGGTLGLEERKKLFVAALAVFG